MKCGSCFFILTCCVAESGWSVKASSLLVWRKGSFNRKCCLVLLKNNKHQQTPSLVLCEGDLKWEITFLNINMSYCFLDRCCTPKEWVKPGHIQHSRAQFGVKAPTVGWLGVYFTWGYKPKRWRPHLLLERRHCVGGMCSWVISCHLSVNHLQCILRI